MKALTWQGSDNVQARDVPDDVMPLVSDDSDPLGTLTRERRLAP
jgi:hypothetical protein